MMRIIQAPIMVFLISLSSLSLFAQEKVFVDNQYFQEYRNRVGIWVIIDSQAKLNFYLAKFSIEMKDFREINGTSINWGEYYFIPYSEKYIKELEEQGIVRSTVATDKNDFIWPLFRVDNISSTFGFRGSRFHTGVDMPATRGTPIVAVMDGRVISTRYEGGFGRTVCMEHRDGFFTRYAHMADIFVKPGDFIRKGQVIGTVGSTGNSTGNHLHFEIRYNDIPLNPLDFLPYKENLVHSHALRNWK